MESKDREPMNSKELAVAYAELELGKQIEWSEDGDRFLFTDTGLDKAWELWFSLPPKDRLTLFLLVKLLVEAAPDWDRKPSV